MAGNDARVERLVTRKGKKPVGQSRRAFYALYGHVGRALDARRVWRLRQSRQAPADRLQSTENDGQQVVEIVGDATGQLTDSFELLRLSQLRFELLTILDRPLPLANRDGKLLISAKLPHQGPDRESGSSGRYRPDCKNCQSLFSPVPENLVECPSDVDHDREIFSRSRRNHAGQPVNRPIHLVNA